MRTQPVLGSSRRGVVAVEMAVLLPVLCFFFLLAADFGRAFYFDTAVTDCARDGAWYGSLDSTHAQDSAGIASAAGNAGQDLAPSLPAIMSASGTDSGGGACIDVTASCPFQMFTQYLGLGGLTLSTRVRMRVCPTTPNFP